MWRAEVAQKVADALKAKLSPREPIQFQGKAGLVLLDQMRTLDKARLVRRLGSTRRATLAQILRTLQDVFAP